MGCSVKCAAHFAMVMLLLGLGAHVAGMLTDYWCIGSRDTVQTENDTDAVPRFIHMGIFRQAVEYSNGTEVTTDSSLNLKEEQYLIVSIAGINCIFCLILCAKAIHVLVGVSSFIIMTLMLLSAFYSYEHTDANMHKLQAFYSTWPTLSLSWSFFLVFFGLVLNIIATSVFLALLLYKGEREASTSSKGLGTTRPKDVSMGAVTSEKHVYQNTAYTTEVSGKLNLPTPNPAADRFNGGHPVSHTVEVDGIQMYESLGPKHDTDYATADNHTDAIQADMYEVEPDNVHVANNYGNNIETTIESSRL